MNNTNTTAGIFLFDNVQTMDFAAPLEVLDQAGFKVFTVGKSTDPVKTSSGQPLIPLYDFSNHPDMDILVVPGGREFDQPLDISEDSWLSDTSISAKHILTICCGSIELARAGLLGKQKATTHHGFLDTLRKFAPDATVISGRKWVEDGKLITSGGLCSGIDASLHLVSKIKGLAEAERIAKWLEFPWAKDGAANS
ncbi:MAG: DJ-1/PfpI family protein [candidate division Zixibacteria bacterium]|nr:DJ-1/PfpI family protein [candidate division Zixibacteria bacterium]